MLRLREPPSGSNFVQSRDAFRAAHFSLAKSRRPCHFTNKGKRMSELQLIETALKRAARRRRWERAWRGVWQGLLVGGLFWLLAEGVHKVIPTPFWWRAAAGAAGGALVLIALFLAIWRKTSLVETA